MFKKIVSLMLVVCVMLTVCITASAAGVEPATPPTGEKSPITITSAECSVRTVTVQYTIDAEKKVDGMDVTVLFYQPVGPEGDKKYITYNDTNAIYYADQVENDVANGKLTFSIPNGAPEGTYNVLVGGTGIDYPALRTGVEVKKSFVYGDVYRPEGNAEKPDLRDLGYLAQYVAEFPEIQAQFRADATILGAANVYTANDVEGEDNIDLRDLGLLAQYVAEFDVTLGPTE